MDTLFARLATLPEKAFGTVVHLGAGEGQALEYFSATPPQRLILVEGDPDRAAALRARTAHLEAVEVRAEVVSARGGPATWRRYNLPSLDGYTDASSLSVYYPRLREVERRSRESTSFAALLERLQLSPDSDRPALLVVDLPGVGCDLLKSASTDALSAFNIVVVRDCSDAKFGDGAGHAAALASLRLHHFLPVMVDAESEPLWPVAICRFDAARYQRLRVAELRAVIEQLHRQVEEAAKTASQEKAALLAERETLRSSASQTQTELAALATERAQLAEAFAKVEDEAKIATQERTASLAELEALRNSAAQKQAELVAVATERTKIAEALDRSRERISGLETEAGEHASRLAAERAARSAEREAASAVASQLEEATQRAASQTSLADKRYLEIAELKQSRSALEERALALEADCRELGREAEQLRSAAEAARREADEARSAKADVDQELRALTGRNEEWSRAREADRLRIGQLESEVQALQAKAADLDKQRAEQEHWHHENAKWAQSLKSENDLLAAELQPLRGAQEALTAASAELRAVKGELESRTVERDARQRLLDIEIMKAEAQLDLIKDVLIREKNF